MIDLSEVVNDPDFAQPFIITRSSGGSFVAGVWQNNTISVNGFGIIQPSTAEELEQVPEADRVKGAMSFHSSAQLYETHTTGPGDTNAGTSDVIAWRGQTYRLAKVFPWEDWGYWKAIGIRKSGE
jgi:hypothetical protein